MSTPASQSSPTNRLIEELLKFDSVSLPVISLYLDTRVNEHGRRDFLPFLRKEMTERSQAFSRHSPERASFQEDMVRIGRYLERELRTSTQGLAMFACAGASDFFEVGQFEAPFENNRLFVSDRPLLYPIARLLDHYRRYAVLLADTNRARIFVFATAEAIAQKEVTNVKTKHIKVGGWSQARYQRHEENYHLLHAKEVIEKLEKTVRDEAIDHIVLAGDEGTVIPLLLEHMPPALKEKSIDVLSLGIETPEHEVLQASLKAFRIRDALSDTEKVEHFLDEFCADNLAVAGVANCLAALSNGQVQELLISASPANIQYDDAEVRKVLNLYSETPQRELNKQVVADELIRRANQLSSAKISFIEGPHGLEEVGGVGAVLRYRITAANAAPYEQGSSVPKTESLERSQK